MTTLDLIELLENETTIHGNTRGRVASIFKSILKDISDAISGIVIPAGAQILFGGGSPVPINAPGQVGDIYFDTITWDVWKMQQSGDMFGWNKEGTISGGTISGGLQIIFGEGAPDIMVIGGLLGDVYFDITEWDVWKMIETLGATGWTRVGSIMDPVKEHVAQIIGDINTILISI